MTDTFNFGFDLVKGKEEGGKRYIYGIASSESPDQANEIVEAAGLKKSAEFFIKKGLIDYDHQSQIKKDPSAIIGKPMNVHWDDQNRMHLKAEIYKGVAKADAVWDLVKAGAPLGLSVGGKVLDRYQTYDPKLNKNVTRVTRAMINHVAVTPFPCNEDTMVTNESYASFFKSLSTGSRLSEDEFEDILKNEAWEDSDNLQKDMAAMGNPVSEGSGGVQQGVNPIVRQDLEAQHKVEGATQEDKKKKKVVKLNKHTVEFDGSYVTINTTDNSTDVMEDRELAKASDADKEKIVECYINLVKAMSDGDKEAVNVDSFLKSRDLDRYGRRIIKRHLVKKFSEVFSNDNFVKSLYADSPLGPDIANAYVNPMSAPYKKDGVIYGAYEDPSFIPVHVPSIPLTEELTSQNLDVKVRDSIRGEAEAANDDHKKYILDSINRIDANTLSEAEALKKFNDVRSSYGKEALKAANFAKLWKEDKYAIQSVIREFAEMMKKEVEGALKNAVRQIKDHVNPDPRDTQNIKDFSQVRPIQ